MMVMIRRRQFAFSLLCTVKGAVVFTRLAVSDFWIYTMQISRCRPNHQGGEKINCQKKSQTAEQAEHTH